MKVFVRSFFVSAVVAASAFASSGQTSPAAPSTLRPADTRIPRNSRFFIAPMDGFETYLAAAIRKKEVPIVMVVDESLADFVVTGNHDQKNAGWAKTIFLGDSRSTASASMQVINVKTQVIAYADSSHRRSANRGERSTAEKLAKYLKKKIEDDEKRAGK